MQKRTKKMNSDNILISTIGLDAIVYYVLPSSSYSFSQHPQLVEVSMWFGPQTWEILSSWCSALIGSYSLLLTFITVHDNTRRWPKVSLSLRHSYLCAHCVAAIIFPWYQACTVTFFFLLLLQWYEELKIINY